MKKSDAWTRLNARVNKAKRIVKAGLVKKVTPEIAKMPSFSVDGRVYNAKLKRVKNTWTIVATCWGEDALGHGPCIGAVNGAICWHTLAAILAGGKKVKFYSTEKGAGNGAWHVVSSQGKGELWCVIN